MAIELALGTTAPDKSVMVPVSFVALREDASKVGRTELPAISRRLSAGFSQSSSSCLRIEFAPSRAVLPTLSRLVIYG